MMGMRSGGEQLGLVGAGVKVHLGGGRCDGVVMVDRVPTIDEIDDTEKLEAYLKTRPAQEARAIALKAAWRVMPMLSRAILVDSCDEAAKKKLVSYVFYANFLSLARVGFKVQTHSNLELPQIVSDASEPFPGNVIASPTAAAYAFSCIFNGDVDRIKSDAVGCIVASTRAISPQEVYWEVVRGDLRLVRSVILRRAFNIGFWPSWSPDAWIEEAEQRFRDSLLTLGADWEVIWSFYRRVMKVGANPLFTSGGSFEAIAELAKEDARFWERDPDVVMKEISLRLGFDRIEPKITAPPEPEPGPGPQYDIVGGKLGIVASPPAFHEIDLQTRLFDRLRRDVERLVSAAHKIDNSHPNLAFSIREYAELLDTPLEALDVTGVWAVGGSLAGFAQSFREQNRNRTLAEPLEPEVDGLLQSVIRQHGAFIMGFEEGRDLVDRADRFALDADKFRGLEESGNPLIAELASNADLVNDDARAVHKSISDILHDVGWTSARNGYTGFLIIQNAVRTIIKTTISNEFVRNAVLDNLGDSFLNAASAFLSSFSSSLLAFFVNFPEMHAYVQCALTILEHDREMMQ